MATGQLIDEDPAEALAHAMAARRLAARISAVREAVGLAAYHAGEWQTAIAELRTYHRMTGLQSHLAVLADCERALGRPERAIDLFRGADSDKLDKAVAVELLIVAGGARGDLGQKDAAVAMLQVPELTAEVAEPWTARLRYAYADALLAVGRREEAREWFARAADVDTDSETDAAERLLELDGVVIEGDDEDDEPAGTEAATADTAAASTGDRADQDDADDDVVDQDDADDHDDIAGQDDVAEQDDADRDGPDGGVDEDERGGTDHRTGGPADAGAAPDAAPDTAADIRPGAGRADDAVAPVETRSADEPGSAADRR
ncbi:Replicase polyprotein 1ab [Micromonospora sp. WMMD714]|uniref:tetratricopeptide repeat protein n=1 Tax=Micromonospora sp. WMMD714 TaxID=3016097 RepID=UPI00249ACA87|nr:Replicase polyprotein 1ab [Micromonospora sp. WMMD714]WFE66599.1 Replicase polyprotein 1ab [Micromonospora sp. WMMD714]